MVNLNDAEKFVFAIFDRDSQKIVHCFNVAVCSYRLAEFISILLGKAFEGKLPSNHFVGYDFAKSHNLK